MTAINVTKSDQKAVDLFKKAAIMQSSERRSKQMFTIKQVTYRGRYNKEKTTYQVYRNGIIEENFNSEAAARDYIQDRTGRDDLK